MFAASVQRAGTDGGFVAVLLGVFVIVPILFGLFRRGAAASVRQSLRRRGPARGGLGLAARYPGFPFDELGWPRVTEVITDVVQGRPMTTFDFSYLDDASVANDAVKRCHVRVVSVALPAVLPTLKIVRDGADPFRSHGGGLDRVRTGDESFDGQIRCWSDRSAYAADVLTPAFRHRFASSEHATLLLQDAEIVSWHTAGPAVEAAAVAAWLVAMIDEVPPVVWQRAAST